MACSENPKENLAKAMKMVRNAAGEGANIVCLPELFQSQYFCQSEDHRYFELADTIPGPTTDALGALSKELGIALVASLFERRAPGVYHNTAVIFDADGSVVGKYRKMHIPDDPLYYEKFYFTPGDLGFQAFQTKFGKIGVCICWDQWYPEASRITALKGAEIIFYPTAIGWHPAEKNALGKSQHSAWETIQRSHAIANGCYVVSANRVGLERPVGGEGIEFWGQSFLAAPTGEILERASVSDEQVLVQALDLARIDEHRTHWPFLRDRRIDAYGEILSRLVD